MGNLRSLKLFSIAILRSLNCGHFTEKLTKFIAKFHAFVLNMSVQQKFVPRANLGCPRLVKIKNYFYFGGFFSLNSI
jgi:hypothetical protein